MSDLIYNINGLGNGLITGLQGAGKSHFVMTQCKWLVDNTDINIYLINVDGVTIDSKQFKTATQDFNWITDAPNNSIIIYDEAGTIERFSNSAKTINSDPQVAELTKLRHHGKQVFFVAQDPSLLHPAVRKLMVKHLHFSNPYNDPDKTHCFVFPQVQDRIDGISKSWKKNAIQEFDHVLDPAIFPLYKSVSDGANHVKKKQKNVKAQRVFRAVVVALILMLLFFGVAVWLGLRWYAGFKNQNGTQPAKIDVANTVQSVKPIASAVNPTQAPVNQRIEADNARYAREQQLYDERLPKDYQILSTNDDLRVSAVIAIGDKCKAYNKRGDLLEIEQKDCKYFLDESGRMIKSRDNRQVITQHNQPMQTTEAVKSSVSVAPVTKS
nr:zonular occludens toxin domain-containing protein [uncultured Moraxella sp.]